MAPAGFRFDCFLLDPDDRLLLRDGAPVELNTRYLDALVLLVRENGRLVSKDRFLDEVWHGAPVTDEALTQCIRTLRRQLGDDAGRPRFIETVPKHGYRFVAPVEPTSKAPEAVVAPAIALPDVYERNVFLRLGLAGTAGAGLAGVLGGLFYGFAGAAQPLQPGTGAASLLLVLLCVTLIVALAGGAGVSFGMAAAEFASQHRSRWRIVGAAIGGLVIGAVVKLLGIDAFNLLLGNSPGDITGAPEGLVLGAAVGIGAWLADHTGSSPRRAAALAAVAGGAAGLAVALLGGRMLGGSLDLLARHFPGSRLRLDVIGALFGESGFGPVTQAATAALEGALFGGCVVGAIVLARGAAQPRD